MFRIVDGRPELTRGDYAELEVVIKDDEGNVYEMQEGDYLTFSMREFPEEESELLVQIHSITNIIVFNPSDTKNVEPGLYSADVELTTADGKKRTVWRHIPEEVKKRGQVRNWENFILMPEVTIDG